MSSSPVQSIENSAASTERGALRASFMVVGGYGLSQVIRLAGNLLLTRLLVPEYFGVMAIANVFIMGIALFSDVGIEQGVIRSERTEDEVFNQTAWTLQVIRGPILFIAAAAIAYPIALFYEEPRLAWIIPFVGLNSLIQGFQSVSYFHLNRRLWQGVLQVMEISATTAGLLVIVVVAYFTRSIWALPLGGIVTTVVRVIWSHRIPIDMRHRFVLERDAVRELFRFGKWIFFSTAVMFLATQADRLMLGRIFSLSFFGVYGIAVIFAEIPKQVVTRLGGKVLFPFASHYGTGPRDVLRTVFNRQRGRLLYPAAAFVALLACTGDIVIESLYDPRYAAAAWILPILSVGIWPLILTTSIDGTLLAVGRPAYSAWGNVAKFLYMIFSVPLMHLGWGPLGAVVAVAMNDLPGYVIVSIGLSRERVWLPKQDLLATTLFLAVLGAGMCVRLVFGLGMPVHGTLIG